MSSILSSEFVPSGMVDELGSSLSESLSIFCFFCLPFHVMNWGASFLLWLLFKKHREIHRLSLPFLHLFV